METADWKKKSLQRSRENRQLKKRIKELTTSRDEWKEKSGYHKKRADGLERDLKKIRYKLNGIIE